MAFALHLVWFGDGRWAVDEVLGLLVGEHDSMTPSEMGRFMDDVGIHSAAELAKASDELLFGALMRKAYGSQRIMSQVISTDPTDPQVALARVYLLMGQRFTPWASTSNLPNLPHSHPAQTSSG